MGACQESSSRLASTQELDSGEAMVDLTAKELARLEKDYPAFQPSHRSRKYARQSDYATGQSPMADGDIHESTESPAEEVDRLPMCCE